MSKSKVLVVGAAGETGGSIAHGLLGDGSFDVIALVRPVSIRKPSITRLGDKGIQIRQCDLKAPEEQLIEVLTDIDVIVSCVGPAEQQDQIPLAKAAKKSGVKRFVPCGFGTVCPPGGIMWLRDEKETIYNQIRQLWLLYTIVDVGWWYQLAYPRLASGRADYAMTTGNDEIIGDGNIPMALIDLRDIGRYMARIVSDPRTLNKKIFAYNAVLTQNEILELMETLSGETVIRNYVPVETICSRVVAARAASETYPFEPRKFSRRYLAEYQFSCGVRGDNNPEYAKYLGYETTPELYPDFKATGFGEYLESVIQGTATGIYQDRIISREHQRHFPRTGSSDSLYTPIFSRTKSSDSIKST